MGERARLGVMAAAPVQVRLRLTAQAFGPRRRIQLRLGDVEIATLSIAGPRSTYETRLFQLPAGSALVELTSLDGTASPGADPRRLSVALYQAELVVPGAEKAVR